MAAKLQSDLKEIELTRRPKLVSFTFDCVSGSKNRQLPLFKEQKHPKTADNYE